ncbi:Lipid kinase [Pseudomonas syringae pv. aceris]|uniref:Lipid kinase n=1 Tax=Pseudomonas syringae pv. aceris TaxID=199198 RepID=A0A0N8QD34_PSESX|nr:Lipid kinase [Pseudomonas syringae pv. aceris]
MTQRRAMLILHGKQALNEDVRDAVADKRKQGWELDVRLTWEAGDAQRLVSEALAAGHRHIVAGGGDGTLRDIAEALALAETSASLTILPLGTANDFARAAGVPLEVSKALQLMDVAPRAVDLGEVGGKLFLNMATGGFGSQVTANTSEDLKKVLGGGRLSVYRPDPIQRAAFGAWRAHRTGFPLARRSACPGYRQWSAGGWWTRAVPDRTGRRWSARHQYPAGASGSGRHAEEPPGGRTGYR